MAKIKNVSPFGDLYVPALGFEIKFGETVDVPDEIASSLLEQPFNWQAGDGKKQSEPVLATDTQEEK